MDEKRVIAVLVSFYPQYLSESVCRLKGMLDKVSDNSMLVLVCNSSKVLSDSSAFKDKVDHILSGSNSAWEFSGWDEGYKYISEKENLNDDDTFIFANDTFCHHRSFTGYNKAFFTYSFKHLRKNIIVGDTDDLGKPFTILGYQSRNWVSTYLLGCKKEVLDKILPFNRFGSQEFNSLFRQKNLDEFCLPETSENMNVHLSQWIKRYKNKVDKNLISSDYKIMKLRAVINEKLISAIASSNSISIVSVYRFRIFKHGKNLPKQVFKKLKQKIEQTN